MKKQTLTLTTLALATFGWVSLAAAQGPGAGHMRHGGGPGGPGFGPDGPGGPGGPGRPRIGMVAEHLGLSEQQKEQWKVIHENARETGEPLMKAAGEAKEAFDKALEAENAQAVVVGQAALAMRAAHNKVEAHRKATLEEVKAILAPDQLAKLEEFEKNRPGPAGNRGFGRGGGRGPGEGGPGLKGRPRPEAIQ